MNKLGSLPVMLAGSEELKKKYLAPARRGRGEFSYCLSEPEAGSDAAAMKTRAVRDGDDWVLNGVKRWITNAGVSRVLHGDGGDRPRAGAAAASRAFVVEKADEGVSFGAPGEEARHQGQPRPARSTSTTCGSRPTG